MDRASRIAAVLSLIWSEMALGGTAMLCLARWQSTVIDGGGASAEGPRLLGYAVLALLGGAVSLLLHWRALLGRRWACVALTAALLAVGGWLAYLGLATMGPVPAGLCAAACIPALIFCALLWRARRCLVPGF